MESESQSEKLQSSARTEATAKTYEICGAKNRQGVTCGNIAGKGTDHIGIGRCKHHGGRNQSPDSKVFKHGLNAQIMYPSIMEKMNKLRQDRDVFDLREHIYLLESLLQIQVEKAETMDDFMPMVKIADTLTKIVQRLHEIEVGRRYVISVENIGSLKDNLFAAVERHVPDPHLRALIADDFMHIYSAPKAMLIEGRAETIGD